jgi:hypothetical protein
VGRNSSDFTESAGGGGLGSLADELGGTWDADEDDEDDEDEDDLEDEAEEGLAQADGANEARRPPRDSGIEIVSSPRVGSEEKTMTSRPRQRRRSTDNIQASDSDSNTDLAASLEARIAAVETLARRGMGIRAGSREIDEDNVISRTAAMLRDLGGQSGIEGGNNRYVEVSWWSRL